MFDTPTAKPGGDPVRIAQLACYKKLDPNFVEDRRSVYWTDGPIRVQGKHKHTDRQKVLAFPKLPHKKYQGDRPSPIWTVSNSAMRARVSNRVKALSCPKLPHIKWQQDKPVQTVIQKRSLVGKPTQRVITLSQPKDFDPRYINPSISLENLGALTNYKEKHPAEEQVPDWVDRLAASKPTPKGYRADRPIRWVVHQKTRETTASDRVDALSKIRRVGKRSGPDVNEVEDPYAVSAAAKRATASARVTELSTPIPRKVRQKR